MLQVQTKVDWQVTDDDREWEALTSDFRPESTSEKQFHLDWRSPRLWLKFAAVLVCITLLGAWRWHLYQADRERLHTELQTALEKEARGALGESAVIDPDRSAHSNTAIQIAHRSSETLPDTADIEIDSATIKDDYVLAEAVIARPAAGGGEQRYRTIRFYSRSTGEWRPTEPTPEMWGDKATLKSEHVIYRFREGDRGAVEAAAPQIDAFYRAGEIYLGLEPEDEWFIITIDIRAVPNLGIVIWEESARLTVPSPARFEVPIEISDAVFLEQMLYLAASKHLIARLTDSIEPHKTEGSLDWKIMDDALRLWLLWQNDSPLAAPSRDAVYLYLRDSLLEDRPYATEPLPEDHQLCELYSLWRVTPMDMRIPIDCTASGDEFIRAGKLIVSDLAPVARPRRYWSYNSLFAGKRILTEKITLTLVLDYVLDEHGPEKLADFLHEFSRRERWESLIPDVFGVSLEEFRSGWLAYLAEEPL